MDSPAPSKAPRPRAASQPPTAARGSGASRAGPHVPETAQEFPVRKVKGLPPRKKAASGEAGGSEDDRPAATAGEMVVQGAELGQYDDGATLAVNISSLRTPSAVLDAYADDALRAITEYEGQIAGEVDADRVGRLHYEIGRLYETVLGDLIRSAHHFDRALVATPQHLPTIVSARRVRLRRGDHQGALELFDREIEICPERGRKAALWFGKGRVLEDGLGRHEEALRAYRAAAAAIEADPSLLKALEQCDRRRQDWTALSADLEALANALHELPPLRAAVVLQRARLHEIHAEQPEQAIELYESALAIDDSVAPEVLPILRRLHELHGRWRDLVRVLQRQADRTEDPEVRAAAMHRIGRVHAERLGNLREAVAAMEASVEAVPRATTLVALVSLHAQLGDERALASTLTDLVDRVPDEREQLGLLVTLGRLCHERLGDDEAAITALEAARELAPADPTVLHLLGPLYARTDSWDELVTMYEAEAEAATHTPQRALAHAQAAEVLERLGRSAAAILHHERALDLDPERHESMRALVGLYMRGGSFRTLADLYERFLDRVDDQRRITFLMNIAELQAGPLEEPEAALVTLRRIREIEARHLGAVQAMQNVAQAAHLWDALLDAIEQEIEIIEDPRQLVTLWHRAGQVLDARLGRRADAVTRHRRALAIDGGHRPTLAALSRLFTIERRWSDLTEIYRRQLELDPKGPPAVSLLQRLGEIYELELADLDEAADCYRRALALDPRASVAGRGLARILEQQQQWSELAALRDHQRHHAEHPDDQVRLAMVAGDLLEHKLDDVPGAAERYAVAHALQPRDRTATEALRRARARLADWTTLADELEREAQQHEDPRRAIEDLVYAAEIRAERLEDPAAAVACLRGVLQREPDDVTSLVALEPLLLALDDHDALIDLYQRQVEVFADSGAKVAALHERARLLEAHRPDGHDELFETYSGILGLRPDDHRALYALEILALRAGKRKALAGVDARLARLAPQADLRAAYLTRRAEAMETGGNPEALSVYREVLRMDPRNRGALRGLVRVAELLRDYEALAFAAERAAENVSEPSTAADAWVRAGTIKAERLDDAKGAVEDFELALGKWPDHVEAASSLSRVMQELGRHRSLAEKLVRAAESATEPDRVAALWLEISALQATELDNPGGAQASLQRLLREQPRRAEAMLQLGRLYLVDRRADEAVELFESCLDTQPSAPITHAAHSLLAEGHERAGRADEAFHHYAAALEADPNDVVLLRRVARLQLDQGHHAAAADAASRLLDLSSDKAARVEALRWVAEAQLGLGRVDEAIDTLAEAVAIAGPRSTAAKEMVERASAPEHWERYVDALKAYLDERAPSGRSRVALFDEIAQLQHERLGDTNGSMTTLIRGLRDSEGDSGLRLRLAQRLSGARRPADAIAQLQILLAEDASRVDAWRLLGRSFGELGRIREQQLATAGLVALGEARPEEAESIQPWSHHTRAIRPGTLAPAAWAELQLGGDQQTAIANLLAAICDGLGKLRPPDLGAWGVASRDRIAPRSDHPLRTLVDRLGSFFALEELDLYVHRHQGRGVGIENTSRPSLLLPIWLGELPQSQQIYLITQALAHVARGTYPVHLMAPRDLALTVAAAVGSVAPGYGGGKLAPPEALDDRARLLLRGVPRRKRRMLESTAQVCAGLPPVEPGVLVHWLHQTAGRLAALVADDIVGVVSVIRRTDELGNLCGAELLARSPGINDLMRVWMSEPVMVVRRRVGLVPAAG